VIWIFSEALGAGDDADCICRNAATAFVETLCVGTEEIVKRELLRVLFRSEHGRHAQENDARPDDELPACVSVCGVGAGSSMALHPCRAAKNAAADISRFMVIFFNRSSVDFPQYVSVSAIWWCA
jgi:hypothetical protein